MSVVRAVDDRAVRKVLEPLPTYRSWAGYSTFKCPLCDAGAVAQFTESPTEVWCNTGCTKEQILEAAPSKGLPIRVPVSEMAEQQRPQQQRQQLSAGRSSWPSADYELARMRARAAAEAQFAEEQSGPDDAWTPAPITTAPAAVEPTILRVGDGPYLLRRGHVCLVSGLPGSAKTPLAYLGVVDAVRRGETAVIIDHEMGPAVGTLLREQGLTDSEIDMQVILYADQLPLTLAARERVVATLEGRDVSYVVIDALADSMPAGASQNDAADVNAWFASLPKWFVKQFNAAVLVIDHSNKEDGPAPGGSVRKQGVPDFRMWLRLDQGFSRQHEDGRSSLIVQRDRTGTHGRGETVAELRNELHGDQSVFVLRPPGGGTTASDGVVDVDLAAMPAAHALRIELLDGLRSAQGRGLLTGDITGGSGAESQTRRKALDWLVKDGQVVWRREPGTSTGRRYWAVECSPGGLDD